MNGVSLGMLDRFFLLLIFMALSGDKPFASIVAYTYFIAPIIIDVFLVWEEVKND